MKKVLLSLSGLFIFFQSFSQLSLDPNEVFAKCPNEFIVYTITNAVNAACNYEWTVTNGEILGGFQNGNTSTFSGGSQVQIKWLNTTSSGSIQVNATNCNPSSGNSSKTWTIPILSINGVNPGAITGDANVTVNVTANKVYSISQINFPNIGSGDSNPFQVSSYEWEIPSGWTVQSGGTTKSITVTPDNCSGGNIRVRGKNTQCTSGPYYTNWSTVKTVTRTIATPSTISGPDFVVCSNTTPIQFTVPAVTGATSYVWTKPSNWGGTSTTNSITLTPSGTDGGNVTVKAEGCSLQSTASIKSVPVELFNPSAPPTISGPSVIPCTGATFTLSNVPTGATVTWLASPGYFYTNSGSGTSASLTPYDLSSGGPGTVTFTVSTACGNFPVQSNEFSVQGLLPGAIYFTNSENEGMYFCSSSYGNYFEIVSGASGTSYEARLLDITGQTVLYTSNVTNYQAGTPNLWSYYPSSDGYYVFEVRGTNECGSTDWVGTEVEYINCSSLFSVSPNPADNYVDIEMSDDVGKKTETELYQITLVDDTGTEILKTSSNKKKQRVDTSPLKKGEYILRIQYKGEVTSRRIIIDR
jgi:hypothetical protein